LSNNDPESLREVEQTMIYFAYGSNLSEEQMLRRCPNAKRKGPATLPDHALAFSGHSSNWGGATATVKRAKGESVRGLLYEVNNEDGRALDRCEGVPTAYVRSERLVVDSNGRQLLATVYVRPNNRIKPGNPSTKYREVIRKAYQREGFDTEPLDRNYGELRKSAPHRVFVYGTLLNGMPNHGFLSGATCVENQVCTAPEFEMYDLGAFPGVVRGRNNRIVGEVYEVDAITLAALDRLEGHPDFYTRVKIVLENGSNVETYLLRRRPTQDCSVVVSGSWAERVS